MWQNIVLGAMALLVLLYAGPGIKQSMMRSRQNQSDWPAVFLPLAVVIVFVVILVAMVR